MHSTTITILSAFLALLPAALAEPRPTPAPFLDELNLGNLGESLPNDFPCEASDAQCISSFVRGVVTSATANPTLVAQASDAIAAASGFANSAENAASTRISNGIAEASQRGAVESAAAAAENASPETLVAGTSVALAAALFGLVFIL